MSTTDSAADRQYAEQLTADLTAGLSRDRSTTVAPSSLASAFTGKTIDLPSVGRQLNVRYLAEGDIRHLGEKLLVTARLTDTKTLKPLLPEERQQSQDKLFEKFTALLERAEIIQLAVRLRFQRPAHVIADAAD